jgi:hypothetical protein
MWLLLLFTWLNDPVLETRTAWRLDLSAWDVYRARVMAVTPKGSVTLVDRDEGKVLIIDATGNLIARIHKPGEGPGEMQAPGEIAWRADKQAIAVFDGGNGRISYWSASGTFLEEEPLQGYPFGPRFDEKGRLYAVRDMAGLNGKPTLYRGLQDETILFQTEQPDRGQFSRAGSEEQPINMLYRWNAFLCFDLGSNFIAVAFGDRNRVQLFDLNGKKIGAPIFTKMPTYPVSDAQIQANIELMPRAMQPGMRRGLVRPESWPSIRAIFVDNSDQIWVIGASPDVGKPHPFRMFSREGASRGRGKLVEVPGAVSRNAAYVFKTDEEGSLNLIKIDIKI